MQKLGEFLSVTNTINKDEDKIIKYFYYRPEQYDNPDSNLETIFDLRAVSGFPQIDDELTESSGYICTNIDISKRLDDTETGVKRVSYVVACTYNDRIKENKSDSDSDGNVDLDKDGKKVNKSTPPWKLRNTFTNQPISVEVPFIKGYNNNNQKVVDIINKAGKRLLASTTRYRRAFTFQYNVKNIDSTLSNLSGCYVNNADWTPQQTPGFNVFPKGTALIEPPVYTLKYWQATPSSAIESYYSYSVKITYDPQGWTKELLNIGTFARFSNNSPAEQIYSYRTINGNQPGPLNFGSLADVKAAGSGVVSEKVTEPLPLTSGGFIYYNAITNPEQNPYIAIPFKEYPTIDFSTFTISVDA